MMRILLLLLAASLPLMAPAEKKRLHFEVEGVGFDMILVEGGTFTMGAGPEQAYPLDDERPQHSVKLSDYYLAETEVTQRLWNAVTGQPLSHFSGDPDLPVEDITWEESMAFVRLLMYKTAARFCLPTEAQWEYAARGGRYSRHYQYAGSNKIDRVAWVGASQRPAVRSTSDTIRLKEYLNASRAHTYPVAQKVPNELGLYDMSGNVAEWTADYYAPYSKDKQKNPQGPKQGTERVYRGGDWYFGPWGARVTRRASAPSTAHFSNIGLRLALPKYYKMGK